MLIDVETPRVQFYLPDDVHVLRAQNARYPVADPQRVIRAALAHPYGGRSFYDVVQSAAPGKPSKYKTAVIVVSDFTRLGVPYSGDAGILWPMLRILGEAGLPRENITLLVGTGTHRRSYPEERVAMYGQDIVDQYHIIDHVCTDQAMLTYVGTTSSRTRVSINALYLNADIKIGTGEIKPHFMVGYSGGRKVICPSIVDLATLQRFHGQAFMQDPRATNLVLAGNPCHLEAMEVAEMVGMDFLLNVTLDPDKRITGVWAGDWREAFTQAVQWLEPSVTIPVSNPYDVVIVVDPTINHYQAAKAACNATAVLAQGGVLIQIANSSDGIGGTAYKEELGLLKKARDPEEYINFIQSRGMTCFDQWQVQKWAQALAHLGGMHRLIYCTTGIRRLGLNGLPLTSGYEFTGQTELSPMVETAVKKVLASEEARLGYPPRVAYIPDCAHAVPVLRQ